MSKLDGSWSLEMSSPLGKQIFLLDFVTAGTARGFAHGADGRVDLADLVIDGDSATFALNVHKPTKLSTKWRMTATETTLAGTVKVGLFPAIKVAGARVGSDEGDPGTQSVVAEPEQRVPAPLNGWRTTAAMLRSGDGDFELEEVVLDPLDPDQVLVRIVSAGICHTDSVARSVWSAPIILGHEGAGVVDAVGEAVTSLRPGDHVVLSFASCGTCPGCQAGRPYDCIHFEALNFSGRDLAGRVSAHALDGSEVANRWFGQSSFARHCTVAERSAVKVDPSAPLEQIGPLGCGIMTGAGAVLNVMGLRPGQRLAVFGVGAVGLAAVLAARASGAGEIVAIDPNPARRALALDLGADRAVDSSAEQDLTGAVLADRPGFDYSFDTTARSDVMATATEVIGRPGLCVLVGAGFEPLKVMPNSLAGKSITYAYMGHANPQSFIPQLVALWQRGRFPFDRLLATYPFEQINAAERDAAAGAAVKPVLVLSEAT